MPIYSHNKKAGHYRLTKRESRRYAYKNAKLHRRARNKANRRSGQMSDDSAEGVMVALGFVFAIAAVFGIASMLWAAMAFLASLWPLYLVLGGLALAGHIVGETGDGGPALGPDPAMDELNHLVEGLPRSPRPDEAMFSSAPDASDWLAENWVQVLTAAAFGTAFIGVVWLLSHPDVWLTGDMIF